ncbi:amino acid permease [Catellatospora sp. NPDC049609]|uniref:APC family permease n=1 Tax=Catellatospora sp. NPDC049609 TaxID=3155505 RepID=UPI00344ACE62
MSQQTLARRTLGAGALWVYAVGASSPLTVLVGGIISTYALTGVVGVPLSFAVITVVVGLLAVGYVAMSRHVVHSAPFYALLARGLNPTAGVAGALVALLGYNAIQISLYGLAGVTLAGVAGGAWWAWAAGVWLIVGGLGLLGGATNAKILGSLLAVELAVIALFTVAAFANPAGGTVDLAGLELSSLLTTGVSGALAFAMAAFVGVESAPAFGEEARPGTVGRATYIGVAFLGCFYLLASLAYSVTVGSAGVVDAARDPERGPFALLGDIYGAGVIDLANILLVTSVIAAMVAFHNTVARYVFALARENVLPAGLASVSSGVRGGIPRAGSLLQSLVAAVVVGAFVLAGADPMATMFTWLSTIAGLTILSLLIVATMSARSFFARGGGTNESFLVRQAAPVLGTVLGLLVAVMMAANLTSLLGTPPGSLLPWLVPGLIAATGAAGLAWGTLLRKSRPEAWAAIGQGTPDPVLVADHRLAVLEV